MWKIFKCTKKKSEKKEVSPQRRKKEKEDEEEFLQIITSRFGCFISSFFCWFYFSKCRESSGCSFPRFSSYFPSAFPLCVIHWKSGKESYYNKKNRWYLLFASRKQRQKRRRRRRREEKIKFEKSSAFPSVPVK